MEMPMKTMTMKLADINPAPYNPRVELTNKDAEWKALEASINENGLVLPLIVNVRTNNTLVSGHQRLNVLKANGVEETEVVVVDIDENKEKSLNYDLNKIDGEWDYGKLYEVISTLEKDGCNFLSTGFSTQEITEIISEIDGNCIDISEFDGNDYEQPDFAPKKADLESGVLCRLGMYVFRMPDDIYEDMITNIRLKVGYVNMKVIEELKRRLFDK